MSKSLNDIIKVPSTDEHNMTPVLRVRAVCQTISKTIMSITVKVIHISWCKAML